MSRSQEFDIPDLGPAEERRQSVASGRAAPSRHAATPAADPGRGGNLLHSLVLVLLTGAASGLGYWGYGLQQDLEVSVAQQAGLAQRLAELEQLLEVTSDSASQSGQTLSGRLAQQGKIATEKYSHFDSEIAKLWTIAYQSNKPRLDTQEKQLALQAEQLKAQTEQLKGQVGQLDAQAGQWAQLSDLIKQQGGQLAAQGGEIKSLQTTLAASGKALADVDKRLAAVSGLEKGQASLKGDLDKTVLEMKRSVATLDTQVRIAEEVQSEKVATLQGAQRTLGDKIAALEAGAGSTDVTRRVRSNEQAIQAIDGSRRQLNRELLQIRQQLNELQLRLR
jgi:chromosome segregation ATPase